MKISAIDVALVDIPTVRAHKLSFATIAEQNTAIVQLFAEDASGRRYVGLGEASTIGGPAWSYESVETIKLMIDQYLAPRLIGEDPREAERLVCLMDALVNGNPFAKAAVEMAMIDVAARSTDLPACQLLGGAVRRTIPCAWTLASGDPDQDVSEADQLMASGRHSIFKIKIGSGEPETEVRRVVALKERLGAAADLRVDVNQAWSRNTARRCVGLLAEGGISAIEQPIAGWDVQGLSSLQRGTTASIMADEAVSTPHDASLLIQSGGVDSISLKVLKSGGIAKMKRVAAIAEGAGVDLYGGTMLEGVVGSAASAHVFATLPNLALGCELFGPLLLTDSIARERLVYEQGAVAVPVGPGFGVSIDPSKLEQYRRDVGRAPYAVADK